MFIHYLKIAWRNLLKYKTLSIISVLGLAIGFTAFAFTMSWIRYERGYDKHIINAERIYRVLVKDSTAIGGVNKRSSEKLIKHLKESYPEIEDVTVLLTYKNDFWRKDKILLNQRYNIRADLSFFHVFYPNIQIKYPEVFNKPYYIFSESAASQLGLDYDDIGQRIDSLDFNLLSIVPDQPKQSNIPFEYIYFTNYNPNNIVYDGFTYILVKEGTDISSLEKKLANVTIPEYINDTYFIPIKYSILLVPLRSLRTNYPDKEVSIKFNHLRLFSAATILVVFCTFFNYITLFISRINLRSRGLALQKINGSSNRQLLLLLFCEFILLLLIALLFGLALLEILYPTFEKFSMIEASKSYFVYDAILLGAVILIVSIIAAYFPIKYFMRRTIVDNLLPKKQLKSGNKDKFSMTTIALQLIISVLLIFSTSLFIYQFNYLNSNYIGFNRYNINSITTYPNEIPLEEIKKVPGVVDAISYWGDFLPKVFSRSTTTEGSDYLHQLYWFEIFGPEFVDFFNIKIIEGRNIIEGEIDACLINQTAHRLLAQYDSVGILKVNNIPVVGVIQDMYIDSPTIPVLPSVYKNFASKSPWETDLRKTGTKTYAYKYEKELRFETEDAINKFITEEVGNSASFINMEELYSEYTKSERYLLTLLIIMTSVAILIAIFGIYSIVTLACNRRRKEIAIRKVNGASIKEIFMLFFKQYFWITVAASAVAFPIGIYIMQRWLEQYTRRISMEWWIFVGIFVLVLLIVIVSMIFRVMKAARENPAEVVKSE